MKEYEWKFMGLEDMYMESDCQMELCRIDKRKTSSFNLDLVSDNGFLSYTLLETRCEIKM
jgi:hypothetical protein